MSNLDNSSGAGWYYNSGSVYVPPAEDGQQYEAIGNDSRFYNQTLSQTFTIATAETYNLSWYDNTDYKGGPTIANYDVTITNAAGALVSSNYISSSHYASGASISNNWAFQSQTLSLQPGTYSLVFNGDNPAEGYGVVIDNVSLVAGLGPFSILSATRQSGSVTLTWQSNPGSHYQVQFTGVLQSSNTVWTSLATNIAATATTTSFTDSNATPSARFYRVGAGP